MCIKKIYLNTNFYSTKKLTHLLVAMSVALSAWVMFIQHGRIKEDTVLYLEVARLFSQGKWNEGMSLYQWSFYPFLITSVHKITSFPLVLSAQLLQILFFAILAYSFLSLLKFAGGNAVTLIAGALLIFSSPYIVGISLEILVRDLGFNAFLLLSVVNLLKFNKTSKVHYALLWQGFIILATLFRIEGITFLTLLPLALLANVTDQINNRKLKYLQSNSISITVTILILIFIAIKPDLYIGRLSEVFAIFDGGLLNIYNLLVNKAQIIKNQVLGKYLVDYGLLSIVITLICITAIKLFSIAGLFPALLLLSRGKNALEIQDRTSRNFFLWFAAIAALNSLFIIFSSYILEGRYILPFCLATLLFSTFALSDLLNDYLKNKLTSNIKALLLLLTVLSIIVHLFNNLAPKKTDYNYEQNAVNWVNTHKNKDQTVFYNTEKLKFYGGSPFYGHTYDENQHVYEIIKDGSIQQYDYVVIELPQQQLQKVKSLITRIYKYQLVNEVSGYNGKKKILIFIRSKTL